MHEHFKEQVMKNQINARVEYSQQPNNWDYWSTKFKIQSQPSTQMSDITGGKYKSIHINKQYKKEKL
jgi:hypothetical protein